MGKTIVIDGSVQEHIRYMPDVYRLRHKIFCEQKGWVPTNQQMQEVDTYDHLRSIYFVHLDDAGEVNGCCRILPTTGPNMLGDIFPELMGSKPVPSADAVWEISRFAVDTERLDDAYKTLSLVTSELLITLFNYAFDNEIHELVAVTDTAFERVLRRSGLHTIRYAPPRKYEQCEAVAGYAVVNQAAIGQLKERKEKNLQRKFMAYEREVGPSGQIEVTNPLHVQHQIKQIA